MKRDTMILGCMVVFLAGGCEPAGGLPDAVGSHAQAIGPCNPATSTTGCTNENGTGIHIGKTQPASRMGFASIAYNWIVTDLTNLPGGGVSVRGRVPGIAAPLDGVLLYAEYEGQNWTVDSITVYQSDVTVHMRDPQGAPLAIRDGDLLGLTLVILGPGPLNDPVNYRLRFEDVAGVLANGQPTGITGYRLSYESPELGTGNEAYCNGADGLPLLAVFHQGAHWSHENAARAEGEDRVTLTCETGAVATCMAWGYKPWAAATPNGAAAPVSLADYHQACIHMKRAAYCGDENAYTYDGNHIQIVDPFIPHFQGNGTLGQVEAYWGPAGAYCVNPQHLRYADANYNGCLPQAIPPCDLVTPAAWSFISGVP